MPYADVVGSNAKSVGIITSARLLTQAYHSPSQSRTE